MEREETKIWRNVETERRTGGEGEILRWEDGKKGRRGNWEPERVETETKWETRRL